MLKITIIWVFAIIVGFFSFSAAVVGINKSSNPQIAMEFWPSSGFAKQKTVVQNQTATFIENGDQFTKKLSNQDFELAKGAFLLEPTASAAVATLALSRKDPARGRLMEKAVSLSRRNQFVNALMIQEKARDGDVRGVLTFYDFSMRSNLASRPVFLAQMVNVLADDRYVRSFVDMLTTNPPWAQDFWSAVKDDQEAIENGGKLRIALMATNFDKKLALDDWLVKRLAEYGKYKLAEELYTKLKKNEGSSTSILRNSDFTETSSFPPLEWQLFSSGDYAASINSKKGTLELNALGGSGGLFARQLLRLPAGRLVVSASGISPNLADANVRLKISCAEPASKIDPISLKFNANQIEYPIQVRSGEACTYYWFDIYGRAAPESDGFDMVIDTVSLLPQ